MTPFTKEDTQQEEKSQSLQRYYIKKTLLERQKGRCSDCREKRKLRLSRIHKNSSHLKESDYILICHLCLRKRQEEQKRAYRPRSDIFSGKTKGGFWNFIRQKVFERDGHKCVWCNTKEHLGLGSLMPLSRGGRLEFDNYVTCCQKCRPSKGNKLPLEFIFEAIDLDEWLHDNFDHALRVKSDPGKNSSIRFGLLAEISEFLHKLTNNKSIPGKLRTKSERLNIKLLK